MEGQSWLKQQRWPRLSTRQGKRHPRAKQSTRRSRRQAAACGQLGIRNQPPRTARCAVLAATLRPRDSRANPSERGFVECDTHPSLGAALRSSFVLPTSSISSSASAVPAKSCLLFVGVVGSTGSRTIVGTLCLCSTNCRNCEKASIAAEAHAGPLPVCQSTGSRRPLGSVAPATLRSGVAPLRAPPPPVGSADVHWKASLRLSRRRTVQTRHVAQPFCCRPCKRRGELLDARADSRP
mmetsp:Transcript_89431/g.208248  ORF Transcript_89431/g.208248 Transcript_89431/m.208248 type:complete len:238 (+) Transcript_89431:268-981(+)